MYLRACVFVWFTEIPISGEDVGEQLLVARRHCYTCITNTLNNLLAMSQGASGIHNNTGTNIIWPTDSCTQADQFPTH